MAALVAYDNYLTNTLLIASNDLRAAIMPQGIKDFDLYIALTEGNIGDICTNLRKSGRTIDNPNHDPANPVAGIPATVPNPGIPIGHITEKRLKMLRYYCFHMDRIQRPFVDADATLLTISECYKLQEQHELEESTKVELPNKLNNVEKIRQVLDDDYISRPRR
jgi:hypothetical protein